MPASNFSHENESHSGGDSKKSEFHNSGGLLSNLVARKSSRLSQKILYAPWMSCSEQSIGKFMHLCWWHVHPDATENVKFFGFSRSVEILFVVKHTHTSLQHMIYQFGGKNIRWHVALNQVFLTASSFRREKNLS